MEWSSREKTLAAACNGRPDDATAERAVRAAELVELACRSMKSLAAQSDEWHARLNDLGFRLGDVAAT